LAISGLYNHTLQIGNRQLTSAVGSLNNPFVAVLSPDYQLFDFPFPDTVRLVCGETFAANHFQPSDASFIWSPSVGVSDTTAAGPVFAPPYTTTYTFLASSPGCTYTDTLHIEVEQLEYQLSFELSDTLLLPPPVAIKITNTSPVVPGIVYTWVISDGSVFDSQAELVNHIFQQPGTYDITLVGTNLLTGCADTLIKENAVTVQEPQVARTGLALAEFALAAYPVPTSGSLTLTGDFSAYQPATAAVYDVAGQLRAEFSLREPVHQVSLDLASGQYLLVVTNAKGQKQQLRLAIVR
jgi:PKD repeat protein